MMLSSGLGEKSRKEPVEATLPGSKEERDILA